MKTFFERINAWFLSLFLVGCIVFIFLLSGVSQEWDGTIIGMGIIIIVIIFSFLLFIFFWLWLIHQSRDEKIRFIKIFLGLVILIVLLIASARVINHFINKHDEEKPREIAPAAVSAELPKDIVKVGKIIYKEETGIIKGEYYFYFSVEVENVSEKYRIENITMSLTAYKDNVAFFKGKGKLYSDWRLNREQLGLNPKGKETLRIHIDNVHPNTFPPKPWTFSTNIESVVGRHFLE